jgi:glutathione peroxidase
MTIYDIQVKSIRGEAKDLSEYRGKLMLVVNTASKCGFTPQYKGLQKLHETYRDQGLAILGFPCNQFAGQEPDNEETIAQQCELNHGVTFPLHTKIDVKGRGIHPLYKHLTKAKRGILGTKSVKWNFTKFLVDREGNVIRRFSPKDTPEMIEKVIEKLI